VSIAISRAITLLILSVLVQACSTASNINVDAPQRANATLTRLDQQKAPPVADRYRDQELRLWHDRPDFAALVDAPPPLHRMRMASAAAPAYPVLLRLQHINARVLVSFVVGTDGQVEDARILESSNVRFNASALKAIREFTFLPAQGTSGPQRELAIQPFDFWWSPKAEHGVP